MAQQLKNTLQFVRLAPGAAATLPHGLHAQRPLVPDVIYLPGEGLLVAADDVSITLTNDSGSDFSGAVLVEAWHTIERAFGDVIQQNLPVKPYIVVMPAGGNQPAWPPFPVIAPGENVTTTIYVRQTGNDTTGDGTLANPFRTFARAILSVPRVINAGYRFIIDITDLGVETLPQDWCSPPITTANEHNWPDPAAPQPYWGSAAPFTIRATPQLASALPPTEAVITAVDAATVSVTPAGLTVVTLAAPRASWAPGALKGLLAIKTQNGISAQSTVFDNTTTELFVTITPDDFNGGTGPLVLLPGETLSLMEPSATLQAPPAAGYMKEPIEFCVDAICIQGVQFQCTFPNSGGGALCINKCIGPRLELCVLNEATFIDCVGLGLNMKACVVRGLCDLYSTEAVISRCYFEGVGTSYAFWLQGQLEEFYSSVFDGCISMGSTGFEPDDVSGIPIILRYQNCWILNSAPSPGNGLTTGDAINIHSPTRLDMLNCQIDSATVGGSGILATGPCQITLQNVTGTGNANLGLQVDDGVHVQVDGATSVNGLAGAYKNGDAGIVATWPAVPFNDPNLNTLSRVSGS